jgi:hypothetical protein
MNIICHRENCKHRKINNSLQQLNICGKETVEIGTTGRCKSFEKLHENFQAVCNHHKIERKWVYGKFIKKCTSCHKIIEILD